MCFYCGNDLPNHDELRKHTKSHGDCSDRDRALRLVKSGEAEVKIDVSDIVCEICDENFSNLDGVLSHLNVKHNLHYNKSVDLIMTPYRLVDLKCLKCEETFDYFSKLISHTNTSHPSNCFLCDGCDQQFNKKRDLKAHKRVHHKNEYSCPKCSLTFTSNAALQNHKKHEHTSMCNVCFQTFSSVGKRLKHMKTEHDFKNLQCGVCHKVLNTKQAFFVHATKCNSEAKPIQSVIVDDCKKPTVKQVRNNIACILNMSTAIPFKHFMNKFRCFYCPRDFTECEDLKHHTVLEHPLCDITLKSMRLRNRQEEGIKIDTSALSCKLCFESAIDLDSLIHHLISEHKAKCDRGIGNYFQPYKLIKDSFPCPICGEIFRYFGILLRHMSKEHTGNKKICIYCGKSFRSDPNLRAHVTRYHKAAKHHCTHCEAEFSTSNDLHLHLGSKHGIKNSECPQCHEKFTSQYWVQRHLINRHGTGHKCSYCGKLFTRHSFMSNHVRRLHLKEKNVECSVCFERFFDSQRLKMHMIKHIGERNFHCDFCGKKFLWKKNLRGHMASHIKHANNAQAVKYP
ncbi:zinc finger protein 62 homolog [Pectinophora gossypiella]|uniref:zinc finger protein 62 homolog n=1 Tax=Pectinophora gossypiella TaxID=13191 RepID=UPI00214F375B|nr:zinc finger protein 62 homolog [Pectinophora gossypiella]